MDEVLALLVACITRSNRDMQEVMVSIGYGAAQPATDPKDLIDISMVTTAHNDTAGTLSTDCHHY